MRSARFALTFVLTLALAGGTATASTLQGSLLVSAERWGIGFSIGVVIAVILATVSGLSRIGAVTLQDPQSLITGEIGGDVPTRRLPVGATIDSRLVRERAATRSARQAA